MLTGIIAAVFEGPDALSDGGLGDVEREYRQRIVGEIRGLIERWIADGLIPEVNTTIVAEQVYSVVNTGFVACFPPGAEPLVDAHDWSVETARESVH